MFFPFQPGATIGTEPRLRVVRLAWSSRTAFTAGDSIRSIRRPLTPYLLPAALWLLTETSSLSWAVLIGCLRRHTAKMWIFVFVHGAGAGVAFMTRTARMASPPRHLVKSFKWQLKHSRAKKSVAYAMVHVPNASGSRRKTQKSHKAVRWFAFLRRPSMDQDLSQHALVLVRRTSPLSLDESARPRAQSNFVPDRTRMLMRNG